MIERHVTFSIQPGKELEFESLVAGDYRQAMAASPGYQSMHLLKDPAVPGRYRMVICFDSDENARDWRASSRHDGLRPRLKPLTSVSTAEDFVSLA